MAFKTKAEKKAFRAGMAKQYNKEHPLYSYVAATKITDYNRDGTSKGSYYGNATFFRTEEAAKKFVDDDHGQKIWNERVLKSVKEKNVDCSSPILCKTKVTEYKRMKPTRHPHKLYDYSDIPSYSGYSKMKVHKAKYKKK